MSAALVEAPSVQQIITEVHKQLLQDIAGFLALSIFIAAVLIWAY
ncbi:hypothetical protein [Agrobacterium burrii]|nr:hypothetical protein [Agrobacterium burrii]